MKTIKRFELRVKRDRVAEQSSPYNVEMHNPSSVAEVARALCEGLDHEVVLAFLLDSRNKIMGYTQVASGGVSVCPVDPKQVFRVAVLHGASGIVLAHNHPSGDCTPSVDDIQFTARIKRASQLLGIMLLDHVIVSHTGHVSMAARGLMA